MANPISRGWKLQAKLNLENTVIESSIDESFLNSQHDNIYPNNDHSF